MIGAIVLAAGSARRFGEDKRLAALPGGGTVIQQSLMTVLSRFDEVLLVLRRDDTDFERDLGRLSGDPRLGAFRAPESALGMGHSLANAAREVTRTRASWAGAFIFLADMPHLRPATIDRLQTAFDGAERPITVPTLAGRYGHPVGFHAAYFAELEKLGGDTGARPVIDAHRDRVIEVPVDDPGILQDVDTPADLSS